MPRSARSSAPRLQRRTLYFRHRRSSLAPARPLISPPRTARSLSRPSSARRHPDFKSCVRAATGWARTRSPPRSWSTQHGYRKADEGGTGRGPTPTPTHAHAAPRRRNFVDEAGMLDQDTACALFRDRRPRRHADGRAFSATGTSCRLPLRRRRPDSPHGGHRLRRTRVFESVHRFTDETYAASASSCSTGERSGRFSTNSSNAARSSSTPPPRSNARPQSQSSATTWSSRTPAKQVAAINATIRDRRRRW